MMLNLRSTIRRGFVRVGFWCSRWETYEGVHIGVLRICADARQTTPKIRDALDLINRVAPFRLRRLRREVQRIWVFPVAPNLAEWHHTSRMCVLDSEFAQSSTTTISQLAATLVHEATHGRLNRLGFKYHEDRRLDIERVCLAEEIRFAKQLPDGQEIIRDAESQMARPASDWTTASLNEARLDSLRQLNCPGWLVRLAERSLRRRTKHSEKRRCSRSHTLLRG